MTKLYKALLGFFLGACILTGSFSAYGLIPVKGFTVITNEDASKSVGVDGVGHAFNTYVTNPITASVSTLPPITGTVTATGPLTDTQLRASVVPTNDTTTAGAQGTGASYNQPAGGSGLLGYLSGIYKAIIGTLTVSVSNTPAVQATTSTAEIGNVKNSGTFAVQGAQATATLPALSAGTNYQERILKNGMLTTATLDDPYMVYGKMFTVPVSSTTQYGTSETAAILVRNPTNSGVSIAVRAWGWRAGTVAALVNCEVRWYMGPTISATGTSVTANIINRNSASATTTSALIYRNPTASANGTLVYAITASQNNSTIGTNNTVFLGSSGSSNQDALGTLTCAAASTPVADYVTILEDNL